MNSLTPSADDDGTAKATNRTGTATLRQVAYDSIEDLLNNGGLKPGDVVSQRELMEKTGATLGAVREAIPRLEAEGLLITLPKRGLMVPSLDITFVRDAYQMRTMIEMTSVPFAIKHVAKSVISGWIDWHNSAIDHLDRGDDEVAQRLQRLDWDIHLQMVSAIGNALITNVYRVTSIKTRMVGQSRIRVTPANASRVIGEHLAFLNPLHAGDEVEATKALCQHIDNSLTLALGGTL